MTFGSRFAAALVAVGLGSVAFGAATQGQGRAIDVLLRAMDRTANTPVSGIFYQKSFGGFRCHAQVQIDQSRDGRIRVGMLQPLSMQGVTSVDDGKTWTTYFPDDRRMVVQESPRASQPDPRWRLEIAQRNYSFRMEPGEQVAGRRTIAVVAVPRNEGLPVRRYTIDQERSYMLRLETIGDDDRPNVLLDTKDISFPNDVDARLFDIRPIGDVRTIKLDAPTRFQSSRKAAPLVGFRPIVPEDMPFGFVVSDKLFTASDEAKFVAIRISDGLVTATVYQWDGRKPAQPWPASGRDREVEGIRLRLIGDLPDGVMSKVLDSFIRKAVKNIGQSLETLQANLVLTISDNEDGKKPSTVYIFLVKP